MLISFTLIQTPVKADNDCYLNTYTKPATGEVCFICTKTKSINPCTTECGSEVCWTGPSEN